MKITIVGSNSFIARNLIYTLKQDNEHELFCYDREESQKDFNVKYTQICVTEENEFDKVNFNVDIIYYFVAITGTHDGFINPSLYIKVNELAFVDFLSKYVQKKSSAKIIYPSTRLIYSGSDNLLREEDKKSFNTVYAVNKLAAEEYLNIFSNYYNIPFLIFRICVPFGSLIPNASSYGTLEFMINKAENKENITLYGDGSLRRTFTYMGELCEVLKKPLYIDFDENVYNIGGIDYSLEEVAKSIAKHYNVDVEYTPWPENALKIETGNTVFDSSNLDNIIKMKYKTTIEKYIKM